jgi:hypothetical protein
MHDAARELLAKLLTTAERRAEDGRCVTLPLTPRRTPEYLACNTVVEREAIHATLANAAAAGAIALEWGRFEEATDLKRLRLLDVDRLAAFLGEDRLGVRLSRVRDAVGPVLESAAAWLQELFEDAATRWRRGDRAHGFTVDDVADIGALYRALDALDRGEHQGLDLRTFSARHLGDSKAMERLQSRIAAVFRSHLELIDLNDVEVYAELGLEKYPQPVFLKGPLTLSYGGKRLDLDGLRPYLALSPDRIDALGSVGQPDYVLVIENLTSYQRHVREVDDRGVVLYGAGFPGPSLRALLARLDGELAAAVSFFHWGDVDLGGLRIFARLAATLTRHCLQPHLMDPQVTGPIGVRPFSARETRYLQRMATRGGPAGELAHEWLVLGCGAGEQEVLEPRSPVC